MLRREDMRPYQRRIVAHVKANPNCAAWVDMGLGKTVSTLTAIVDLQSTWDANKVLVIAPLRVARKTWDDEIQEWEHLRHLKTSHIIGTAKQRLAGLRNKDADIYLINRENMVWLKDQFVQGTGKKQKLIRQWPFDMVVIDESSSFKSASSKRFKAIRSLRKLFDRCVLLTGTPAPNGYTDLWSQINLLDRGMRLGTSMRTYKRQFFYKLEEGGDEGRLLLKPEAKDIIHRKLRDIVISMQAEDYLDLPPVVSNKIPVYLDDAQKAKYRELATHFVMELNGEEITAMNAGALTGKLLQLANGAIYRSDQGYEEFHDHKLNTLEEMLDDASGPVMVTAWYKSDQKRAGQRIDKWCKENGKTWEVLNTAESEDRWNEGKTDVLLLHPASAGHGLNLHKNTCETIIWYGLTWSLELYQQLNARIAGGHRRIGKNVVIHHILTQETIDNYVWGVIRSKDATQSGLLSAVKTHAKEIMK